jgi:hypothetical protein
MGVHGVFYTVLATAADHHRFTHHHAGLKPAREGPSASDKLQTCMPSLHYNQTAWTAVLAQEPDTVTAL